MDIAAIIISGVSLLVAIVSFAFSFKSQRLQNRVNEIELKLKENELLKIEKEACIEARVIHPDSKHYYLKIWNSGNDTAYNVNVLLPDEKSVNIFDNDKLPYEELEASKSFEIPLLVYNGSASKFYVTTEWKDSKGNKKTKNQLCSR